MNGPSAADRGCALVTGASRGIGAAVARELAAAGWPVGVNYRAGREQAEAVVEEIRSEGGVAVAMDADVCDALAVSELVPRLERALDRPLLALVNNAGIRDDRLVPLIDDRSWQAVLETNLTAAFRLTRSALRPMLRERFGRIVNVASVVGERANPGQASYAAAKAGLIGLTRTVAVEVASRSVTVNAIAPGVIVTEGSREGAETLLAKVPAERPGTVEEVAACARFLVSDRAGYVTGSVLTVDGGLSA